MEWRALRLALIADAEGGDAVPMRSHVCLESQRRVVA